MNIVCITFLLLLPVAAAVTELRLSGGDRGLLEIYHAGEWGTICDDSFGLPETRVACRQLGFSDGILYTSSQGVGNIWLDDLRCTGNESALSECGHNGWGSHDCRHYEDVGVLCFESGMGSPNFRLSEGDRGLLEISIGGEWGTVCDDGFTVANARVVCRQLGHSDGVWYPADPGVGQIWLDNVNCMGTENSLAECRHAGWGSHNCRHHEDVGIICFEAGTGGVDDVRLTNGDHGRLEVRRAGIWGTVCDDYFDEAEAAVVCQQLGFGSGHVMGAAPGSGPIWLDDVRCTGSEMTVFECNHLGWGMHNCEHSEDVGVDCREGDGLMIALIVLSVVLGLGCAVICYWHRQLALGKLSGALARLRGVCSKSRTPSSRNDPVPAVSGQVIGACVPPVPSTLGPVQLWEVVDPAGILMYSSTTTGSAVRGHRIRGEVVAGVREGDWVALRSGAGFIPMRKGKTVVLMEKKVDDEELNPDLSGPITLS